VRCRKARWYLCARCDETLSERQRKRLNAHLELCSECRRESFYFAELTATASRMETVSVRPDFNLRLRSAIQRAEPVPSPVARRGWFAAVPRLQWRPAYAFAMAAALVLIAFGSFQYSSYRDRQAVAAENARIGQDGELARDAALGLGDNQSVVPPQWSPVDGLSPEMRRLQEQYLADHKLPRNYILGGDEIADTAMAAPGTEYVMPVVRSDQMMQQVSY